MLCCLRKERMNLDDTGGREDFSKEAVCKLDLRSELVGGESPGRGESLVS